MEFPLHLKYCSERRHAVCGLLIPGDDVSAWLSVALREQVPFGDQRFLIVAEQHGAAANVVAALCLFPATTNGCSSQVVSATSAASPLSIDYGCRAGRLYLPVNSELSAAITDSELDALLPGGRLPGDSGRLFVWHPTCGLIGFDAEHVLSAADLLSGPPDSERVWDAVEVGPQLSRAVRSLSPEASADFLQMLDEGKDDIGGESENIENVPRAPDEKSGAAIRDAMRGVTDGVAKAIHGITSKLPTAENGNAMLGKLHRWAESVLAGTAGGSGSGGRKASSGRMDSGLSTRRENEIKRLLNLLKNDPDKGLKFALPLGGEDRSRGISRPTDRLGEHDIDLHSNSWRGSGRGDSWDLPWEYQAKLQLQYREIAQREMRLGRYRRAAYIYARLLNDFTSAAGALEAGRLYHDAASIYLEHLRDFSKAAACFRSGGFWEEALQIYRNHERWIAAGELYQEIGDAAKASEMFQHEVNACERRRDYSTAATVADHRLDNAELATELLITGWMQGLNGRECFRQIMNLHGRRGMHREVESVLRNLTVSDNLNTSQLLDAVTVCSENAIGYPEDSVRISARRHTFRLAAVLLKPEDDGQLSEVQSTAALAALRRLDPGDGLLQADAHRFETELQQPAVRVKKSSPVVSSESANHPGAKLISRIDLPPAGTPPGTRWLDIVCNGSFVFYLGITPQSTVVFARQTIGTRLDGRLVTQDRAVLLPVPLDLEASQLALRLNSSDPERIWVVPVGTSGPWCTPARNIQAVNESEFVIAHLPDMGSLLDVCDTSSGWLFCLDVSAGTGGGSFGLNIINSFRLVDRTVAIENLLDVLEPEASPVRFRLYVDGTGFFVVAGRTVVRLTASVKDVLDSQDGARMSAKVLETLPFSPINMTVSPNSTMTRLVFSFEEGMRVVWKSAYGSCLFGHDLVRPVTAFSSNGILAAACAVSNRIDFYRLSRGQATLVESTVASESVTHLTCGPAPNQILAFHPGGGISQYAIPFR
ncbi:MAG: hypothetical protein WAO83_11590 [Fuerstiella sp.]